MKILMTADAVGGVWNYAAQLASLLSGRGVRVVLATMGPDPSGQQRADAARIAGLELHVRPFALEWMPAAWHDVDRASEWLLDLERQSTPDLVHLNGYVHAALPWRSPCIVVAHSCVWSWWDSVYACPPPAEWNEYRRRVTAGLHAAAKIVTPSDTMRRALMRFYAVGDDAVVIPNCSTDAGATACEKEPLIFAAGRVWDPAKNVATLDAAAQGLPWPVYVAGEATGPTVSASSLSHARGLGRLSPPDVERWMSRASIYAFPARYEPFGLSVLEAARAGCALVLGDIPSLRENWDGAARFVNPQRADLLHATLLELIRDQSLCRHLGDAARNRARAFSAHRHVSAYLDLYRDLVMSYGGFTHSARAL